MTEQEELRALRRLAELESKASGKSTLTQQQKLAMARAEQDPTEGTGFGQQMLEGAGKFFTDIGRGAGQYLGLVNKQDVDEAKRLDAPLMAEGRGGNAGVVGAGLVTTLPAAFLRGANTLAGATGIGAGIGALEPTGTGDSTLKNIGTGAAFGAGGVVAGRGLEAGARGAKALVEPFYKSGQDQIAGRVLNEFATDPRAALAAMANAPKHVPGSVPTVAEAAADPGLAGLQLNVKNQPAGSVIKQREISNMGARTTALKEIAGAPGEKEFFEQSRNAVAQDLYERAFKEVPENSTWIKGEVTKLMQRPAFVDALKKAQENAMNEGIKVSPKNPENTTQILHYTKMALDDAIEVAKRKGEKAEGLISTKDKLVSLMESKGFSPSYREARDTYKQMSKPINQMEVGERLYRTMVPALMDFSEGAITRTKGEKFAQALLDEDRTLKAALGRGGSLDDVMGPEKMGTLNGIAKDLARRAVAEDMAKTTGSTTAQNLAGQNVLRQLLGPTGLPQSWAESSALQTMLRPVDFAAKRAEPKIQERLAAAMLDPGDAARLMQNVGPDADPTLKALALALQRYLPASAAMTGTNFPQ